MRDPGISLERLIDLINECLHEEENKWLLIYDNLDNLDVFREAGIKIDKDKPTRYLPSSPNGSVLVTTQAESVAIDFFGEAGGEILRIDEIATNQAIQILKNCADDCNMEEGSTAELLKNLASNPLSIVQAGFFLKRNKNYSMHKYLNLVQDYMENPFPGLIPSVSASLQITYDLLRKQENTTITADILLLMSCYNRQGIHRDGLSLENLVEDPHESRELSDALETLEACSFVNAESDDFYQMHPLVHEMAQHWRKTHDRRESFEQQFIVNLRWLLPFWEANEYASLADIRRQIQECLPHLNVAISQSRKLPSYSEWAWLVRHAAVLTSSRGMHSDAERLYKAITENDETILECHEYSEKDKSDCEWMVMKCYHELGTQYFSQKRYKEVVQLADQGLRASRTIFNREGACLSIGLNYLKVEACQFIDGQLATSERSLREVVEKAEILPKEDRYWYSFFKVGRCYTTMQRYDEALHTYNTALENLKLSAINKITLKNGIGVVYYRQDKWGLAIKLFEETLDLANGSGLTKSIAALDTMYYVAETYNRSGNQSEALKRMREYCEIARDNCPGHGFLSLALERVKEWEGENEDEYREDRVSGADEKSSSEGSGSVILTSDDDDDDDETDSGDDDTVRHEAYASSEGSGSVILTPDEDNEDNEDDETDSGDADDDAVRHEAHVSSDSLGMDGDEQRNLAH